MNCQDSFDPSIYSMDSVDPSSNNEEFDPSDNEDDNKSVYSSRYRDSWNSRRSGSYDIAKLLRRNETATIALQEKLNHSIRENEKLREERDALSSALKAEKVDLFPRYRFYDWTECTTCDLRLLVI